MFAHIDGWQWRPDMMWYDNVRMFKTVSYYVQQMYAQNRGTNVLPLLMNGKPVAGQKGQDGLFASAVTDRNDGTVVVKVINTSDKTQNVTLSLKGMKQASQAVTTTLTCTDMDAENTLDTPDRIVPLKGTAAVAAAQKGKTACSTLSDTLPAKTFRVYRIKK